MRHGAKDGSIKPVRATARQHLARRRAGDERGSLPVKRPPLKRARHQTRPDAAGTRPGHAGKGGLECMVFGAALSSVNPSPDMT
ncbi:hypothetical protein D3OALGA1CA_4938 [Olavius algarvensis associated proteobacterium Delta 3]|nr:hypothetical protein D3OALGA1CA_4938 [Olavius algarvensis associated proteobacterium Delta 3]